ncbi:MAG: hypothetical protein L0H64_20875 [Pseudonocardia sp.]|nr:hypothetical protein [Pseudonocardia sp.]
MSTTYHAITCTDTACDTTCPHGPPLAVTLPVRLSVGGSAEVIGEIDLRTAELDDPPSRLERPDARALLADLLEAAAAELRTPTV